MTNTQVYKTLLSIIFAILVMLVFMVAVTGCSNPPAPEPEPEVSQETIDRLFATGMNTPL